MLNEMIDKIGQDKIDIAIKDIDLSGNQVFLIDKDSIKKIEIVSNDIKENLEDIKYIKERVFWSNYISSDKAVVYSKSYKTNKVILTCTKFTIGFNKGTLLKKAVDNFDSDYKEYFNNLISNYYSSLRDKFDVKCTVEEALVEKHKEYIYDEIMKKDNKSKVIKIFIKADIKDYEEEFYKYFYKTISDADTVDKIKKDKDMLKIFADDGYVKTLLFSTLNTNKPLLSNVGAKLEYAHLYDRENLMKFYKFKKYMDSNINVQKNYIDNLYFNFNCKDKAIEDYDQNPFINSEDDKERYRFKIEDLLGAKDEVILIESRKRLFEELNKYISFAITRTPEEGKEKTLNQKYKNILAYSKYDEKNKSYDIKINDELFDAKVKMLIEDIILYSKVEKSREEYSVLNMRRILNIKFAVSKFYDNEYIGGDKMVRIKDSFKAKILADDIDTFDSIDEFMFAVGQLANCLVGKSKGKLTNSLIGAYQSARDYRRLISLLDKDMGKYNYATNLNSRESKVMGAIKVYVYENKIEGFIGRDKDMLDAGLYSKNLFYTAKIKDDKE